MQQTAAAQTNIYLYKIPKVLLDVQFLSENKIFSWGGGGPGNLARPLCQARPVHGWPGLCVGAAVAVAGGFYGVVGGSVVSR